MPVASPEPPLSRKLTFQSDMPESWSHCLKPASTRCSDWAAALECTQAISSAAAEWAPKTSAAVEAAASSPVNRFFMVGMSSRWSPLAGGASCASGFSEPTDEGCGLSDQMSTWVTFVTESPIRCPS